MESEFSKLNREFGESFESYIKVEMRELKTRIEQIRKKLKWEIM